VVLDEFGDTRSQEGRAENQLGDPECNIHPLSPPVAEPVG
jgi:hypothetical protein